jgi:cell division protein FtsB
MSKLQVAFDACRSLLKRAGGPLLCVFVLFYLGFHAVSGERGLLALFQESRKLEMLKAELAEVTLKREAMDKKVRGLSSSSLDLDLLDERARVVLGMGFKDEVVVFLKNTNEITAK